MTDDKTCNRCGKTKPLNHFSKRTLAADGHASQCLLCTRETSREGAARRKAAYAERTPPARKECSRCHEVLPATEFARQNTCKNLLASACKACKRRRYQELYSAAARRRQAASDG